MHRTVRTLGLAVCLAMPCAASTITTVTTFGSGLDNPNVIAINDCNGIADCDGTNYYAIPNPAWVLPNPTLGVNYISATSDSGASIKNGTTIGYFWLGFLPTGSVIDSVTEMLAWDDAGKQTFNGATIYDNAASGPAVNCANTEPTCTKFSRITFTPASAGFLAQTDTFTLLDSLTQKWGGPSGLVQWASVASHVTVSDAPEPGTWTALAGVALIAIGLKRRAQ